MNCTNISYLIYTVDVKGLFGQLLVPIYCTYSMTIYKKYFSDVLHELETTWMRRCLARRRWLLMKILWSSSHWRLKMVWWSGRCFFAKWIYSRNQLFFSPLHRQIFCFFSTFHSWTCPNLNILSFCLLLSYFLSKRPQFLHSISMDLPKKLDFSLHLQTCQSSVYAVRCLDFGNSTGRTAPSAKVKVVLVQQIHQHHPQKQLLA